MTYTLTPEEMEKVRDLVRILTFAQSDIGCLSSEQEKLVMKLAQEIQRFIQ